MSEDIYIDSITITFVDENGEPKHNELSDHCYTEMYINGQRVLGKVVNRSAISYIHPESLKKKFPNVKVIKKNGNIYLGSGGHDHPIKRIGITEPMGILTGEGTIIKHQFELLEFADFHHKYFDVFLGVDLLRALGIKLSLGNGTLVDF